MGVNFDEVTTVVDRLLRRLAASLYRDALSLQSGCTC